MEVLGTCHVMQTYISVIFLVVVVLLSGCAGAVRFLLSHLRLDLVSRLLGLLLQLSEQRRFLVSTLIGSLNVIRMAGVDVRVRLLCCHPGVILTCRIQTSINM